MIEKDFSIDVLAAVRKVCGVPEGRLALHEPLLTGNERRYLLDCIDTGYVSSIGSFVTQFEEKLALYTGAKHVIATVNGTAALTLACQLAGVERGDEVLVPTLTFVATANSVSYLGGIPHFVDSDERSLGVDPIKLEAYLSRISDIKENRCINKATGRTITALIVMHAFGHAADLDTLSDICRKFRLTLIEDAAESLGTFYKGKHTGNAGTVSILSFNGNKIATTGGGGALVTNDSAIADKAKHLSTTAKEAHPWQFVHNQIGYNFRLPNINAALGVAQLEALPSFLERKRTLAEKYSGVFEGVPGIRFFKEPSFSKSNYWLNLLLLDTPSGRDTLLKNAHESQVLLRPAWQTMHRLPMYQSMPKMDLSQAENLESRLICLPSSAFLGGD